jgi:hypothetical protein
LCYYKLFAFQGGYFDSLDVSGVIDDFELGLVGVIGIIVGEEELFWLCFEFNL